MDDRTPTPTGARRWSLALLHALPVTGLVLGLIYHWFAIADRYIVFLYYHDMGPLYPDTSPFSRVTSSRYWMAGLVAAGAVMVLYTLASWLLGRLARRYRPPAWWRVWVPCAAVLVVAIPAITMTANQPVLPLSHAVRVTASTLVGLALALTPAWMAAERPVDLALLAVDGLALMLVLLSAISIEDLARWLARGQLWWVGMAATSLLVGVALLLFMTGIYAWRRRQAPTAREVYLAGLCVAYLLMPLVHHVFGTDGYFYITDSDNFFARNIGVQVLVWLIAAALAVGVTWLRRLLADKTQDPKGFPKPLGS